MFMIGVASRVKTMKKLWLFAALLLCAFSAATPVYAVDNPQNGSVGLEATIPSAPPSKGATITTPSNGAVITSLPVTVGGLCPTGLLVKVFSNSVFVGSVVCTNGSYRLQVDLFSGRNDLVARVYDALDQPGPDSNIVSVTFTDAQFLTSGSRVVLTSNFARRGANPGDTLEWPVSLSGGTPPYALSVDWGDGKGTDLQSVQFAGTVTLKHVYDNAGTYKVIVKATDTKGSSAFLQLVGVANGAIQSNATGDNNAQVIIRTIVIWWPLLLSVPLIALAFWLGRRHELYTLRRHLENQ
jgi:hypothetical protein